MRGLGKIEGKSAPTAADVEHLQSVAKIELGGEVTLLGCLRFVQRHSILLEIGAGILSIAVEEQLIEAAVEVVVMLDVAFGAGLWIELAEPAAGEAEVSKPFTQRGQWA